MPTEPGVTVTDYLLALQCAWTAWWCWRRRGRGRGWFTLFFASLCAAALLGGTMHGYFTVDGGAVHEGLWLATLLSIGATAAAMWGMVDALAGPTRLTRTLLAIGMILVVGYIVMVCAGARAFTVALTVYLPPALALLAAFVAASRSAQPHRSAWGVAGVVLTFVAAGIQASHIDLHPIWCDHNALYHLVQMTALGCVGIAVSGVITPRAVPGEDPPCR